MIVMIGLIVVMVGVRECGAGAWTTKQGSFYDRPSMNYYFADEEFDSSGNKRDFERNGEFQDLNLSNYLEYGLRNDVTLINAFYYKRITKTDDFAETTTYGIGDVDLGIKYRIHEGTGGVLSSQVLAKVPGAYDRHEILPLGNGQLDLEVRVLYGRSLWELLPGYANVEIGYRWRFEDPSDEVRYLIELGADFTKTVYGRLKLDGIMSMDNGKHRDAGGNPTTTNNFDLGKIDMTLGHKLSEAWGVEIGYAPTVYGQNTASGTAYTIALTYQSR